MQMGGRQVCHLRSDEPHINFSEREEKRRERERERERERLRRLSTDPLDSRE